MISFWDNRELFLSWLESVDEEQGQGSMQQAQSGWRSLGGFYQCSNQKFHVKGSLGV